MALSITSIANYLFKKQQGKSSTNDARQFFEEPIDGRPAIFPVQVWAQGDLIPTTAPTLADQAVSGVVKRWSQLQLAAVPGTTNAFSHASLKDCIPFNFGDGSYNYALFDSGGAAIPFGQGDWIVDPAVGTLTFYTSTPGNMPPKISFFQYVGAKGLASQTPNNITFTEQTSDPAAPASGFDILYFKAGPTLWAINNSGVIRQFATLNGVETLSNKTLQSPVTNLATITTGTPPATPASGSVVLFAGTNNSLWSIDSTGAQKQLGTLTGTETFTNKTLTQPILDVMNMTDQTSDPARPAAGTTLLYTKNKRLFIYDSTTAPMSIPLQVATLQGTETLTNKTLTGPIVDVASYTDQSSSPNQPVSGSTLLYSRNGAFYKKSGIDGLEQLLGGSGGAAGKNYLATLYDGSNVNGITPFNAAPAVTASRPDLTYQQSYFSISQAHALGTGMAVVYTSTGQVASPLVSGSTYYVILTGNGIQMAASLSDALAKKFITLTSPGALNTQTFTPVLSQANAAYVYGSYPNFPAGSPAGLTAATNTTTPVRAPSSQRLSVDANNRLLSGWSTDFTMDKADYVPGQLMKFTMTYVTSANYAGDILVGVEDTTNYYPVQVNQAFADTLPATNAGVGRYVGYFYASAATPTYRLTLAIQTTNASGYTIDINDLTVTNAGGQVPGIAGQRTALSDTLKPTVTAGSLVLASTVYNRIWTGRVGDMGYMRVEYQVNSGGSNGGTTGANASYVYNLPAPGGQQWQFDPARVQFNTGAAASSNIWDTKGAILVGDMNDNQSQATISILPLNATQYRLGIRWTGNNANTNRGIHGPDLFNLASGLTINFQCYLPILGFDMGPTYSTNEIALKNQPLSVNVASQALSGTNWTTLTGNSLTLPAGTWDLTGSIFFTNNGSSPGYTVVRHGWFAANGANTTTPPAALSTIAGATVFGIDASTNPYNQHSVATLGDYFDQCMPVTIKLTQATTIYYVPECNANTVANARVVINLVANKRPDYSAFGVYGQVDLRSTTSSTTGANGTWTAITNNSLTLPVGTWKLKGSTYFSTNGTSPGYTDLYWGVHAANGTGTATNPAAVSTLANVVVLTAGQHAASRTAVSATEFQAPDKEIIVRVTTGTATFYVNFKAFASNGGNAIITGYLNAERLQ